MFLTIDLTEQTVTYSQPTMSTTSKPPGYDEKSEQYFQLTRQEMMDFIPKTCKTMLDVGCGSGGFGQTLKRSRTIEIWGVEPVAAAAALAATRLDHVIESPFVSELPFPPRSFDCIVFNDVLEHLIDPAATLKLANKFLSPTGCIVASIPNVRHFPTMWALFFRKEWIYRDCGILDSTHLRFFTRKSIEPLFKSAGFYVERIEGINSYISSKPRTAPRWRYFVFLNCLTFGFFGDMRYLQYAVVARPNRPEA